MSRRKKQSHAQKMRARVERETAARHEVVDLLGQLDPGDAALEAEDWAERLGLPLDAVEAYQEVFTWAAENPQKADELVSWDEQFWGSILSGIAFPEIFDLPEDEVRQAAWQLKAWNILKGYQFTMSWPTPIAQMSEDEIIAQLRQDAKSGKIPEPGELERVSARNPLSPGHVGPTVKLKHTGGLNS